MSDEIKPFPAPVVDAPDEGGEFVGPSPDSCLNTAGTMRHSKNMGQLCAALAKAKLAFDPILKESENPAFRSRYADLASILGATQKALAENELVAIQSPTTHGRDLTLTTLLLHKSGEWIASDLTMPATMRERFDAQAIGSAVTYARRYALQSVLGVAGEDDDGNAAAGVGSKAAADAVAQRKIAEHKAKQPTKAEIPPTERGVEGYGPIQLVTKVQNPQKTRSWIKVVQAGFPLTCFDNPKLNPPLDGHLDFFSFMLAESTVGKVAEFHVAIIENINDPSKPPYHNIVLRDATAIIGDIEIYNGETAIRSERQ